MATFTAILTPSQLTHAAKEWDHAKELAIDLECENNLHHYGTEVALAQISTGKKHWILDLLSVKEPKEFLAVLRDKNILKVFHDVDFDFRMLKLHYKTQPKNIFDTKIAAQFLNKEKVGLGGLLEEYFKKKKESKYQRADWTTRPLKAAMLEYAIGDVTLLLQLKDKLRSELKKTRKYLWAKEEFSLLERKNWTYKHQEAQDVKGYKSLTPIQQNIFTAIFTVRETIAKKNKKPPFYIMSNKKMLSLAERTPKAEEWKRLRQIHPSVKEHSALFSASIREAQKKKVQEKIVRKKKPNTFTKKEHRLFDTLSQARERLSEKHALARHLIITKEDLVIAVTTHSTKHLKKWQQELLNKYLN